MDTAACSVRDIWAALRKDWPCSVLGALSCAAGQQMQGCEKGIRRIKRRKAQGVVDSDRGRLMEQSPVNRQKIDIKLAD